MDFIQLLLISLIALGLGLAFLLVGYRFFLLLLPIWGFFAGLWLGAQSISWVLGEGFLASVTGLVVGFLVGLILAAFSYLFYSIGILVLGAFFGYWFSSVILYVLGFNPGFFISIAGIISAIVFATLTVLLDVKKHLVIIITAFAGAGAVLTSLMLLTGAITVTNIQAGAAESLRLLIEESAIWMLVWLALAIISIIFQERSTSGYLIKFDRQYDD